MGIEEIRKDPGKFRKPDVKIRRVVKLCKMPKTSKQIMSIDRMISDIQCRITLSLTTAKDAGSPWAQHLWYEIQKLRSERTALIDQIFSEGGVSTKNSQQGTAGEQE